MIPTIGAANPAGLTGALQSAPVSNELPSGQQDTGSGLGAGSLRPQLDYPTLRMDEREPRAVQASETAPVIRAQPAAPVLNDFQMLVSQSLGLELPRFGHSIFADNSRGFEPIDPALIPPDFILGPGDEVYIRAWGSIEIDYRATIGRQGSISLPKIGEIPLAGVRYLDLSAHIRAALGRVYQGFDLTVSLGQLRSIRVYLTGFARAPGTYTVNSLTSLVNALFFAGGPSSAGDLRNIELRRSGKLLTEFDFYDFLVSGDYDNDLRLQPGDVIHIPPMLGEVAIAGAVNRAAIYQLKDDDTLQDLVEWGGGLGVAASTHRVMLERISGGRRVVEELPLSEANRQLPLQPGDLVVVQPVSPQFSNAVTLRGHVAQPFRHEWREGMRISDLLPSSEALISPGYWVSRNEGSQLIELLGKDVATTINADFPEINWEYALLERVDRKSLRTLHIPFHLGKAVKQRDASNDLILQPEDKITVFSLRDFRTPVAERRRLVRVEGEVSRGGFYEVEPGASIADVIELAGGITADAYLFGVELRRESVRQQQKLRINEAIDQLEQDYNRHLIDRSRNVLSGDLTLSIAPEADAIRNLIGRLREADPSGRIVLELGTELLGSVHDLPNFPLDDGDTIYVPPKPATVEVVGAVFRQGSFLHSTDVRIGDYLENAGLLDTADRKQVYLIRPDGSFDRARNRSRLHPGDTVFVPEKTDRQRAVRRLKDWTQVVYQFGLGAAGINLLEVF
ncbi:MAG: SLBB domain-containing protein [Gammaproteobacteria bacterium]|nr:SLBB domain-containing protein [Gammaproteobacteria bacterium]